MNLKASLIALTLISVICDTLVLPFYPQFFAESFMISDPQHVGYYVATCCVTVMLMFPVWAKVARYLNEVHIWVYTQVIAGALGIACYLVTDLVSFWIVSQLMLVFKASYLLIYPYVMRLEQQDTRINIAGLFAVLMHFGAIGGALIGGMILDWVNARFLYLIMAAGDATQVVICLYLIKRFAIPLFARDPVNTNTNTNTNTNSTIINPKESPSTMDMVSTDASFFWRKLTKLNRMFHSLPVPGYVVQLGVISLLFYFAAFAIRPFLSSYWASISNWDSTLVAGLVYAIPGLVALLGLWANYRFRDRLSSYHKIALAMLWAIVGTLIQSISIDWLMIIGRLIYGWGLFQVMVTLEVLLFQLSKPSQFAQDYSQVHLFQNIGLIFASLMTGFTVAEFSLSWPFYLSAIVFVLTLLMFLMINREHFSKANNQSFTTQTESI